MIFLKIEWGLKLLTQFWEYKHYVVKKENNRKLTTDTVLLTKKYRFCSNIKKFYARVYYVFILYLRLHIVLNCIEQFQLHATNSDKFSFHFYSITNIF